MQFSRFLPTLKVANLKNLVRCTRFFLNSAQGPIGIAGGGAGWSESKEIDSLMIPDRDLWCAGFRSAAVVDFEKNLVQSYV